MQPHVIDKTIFENDKALTKAYKNLTKSNSRLKKDLERLETSISKGNFQGGRTKGLQKWKGSNNIYYMGNQKSGARIYFKFTGKAGEYKVSILGYSNKPIQTSIANHIVIRYDD